jgi:Putative transmembrane protein (Alph_Pro_TM)
MKLLLALPLLLSAGGTPPQPPSCRITPRQIEIGTFYSGAEVKVEGMAAAGSKVIVTVVGSDRPEVFNRKGRFGPIWLTAGRVRISGVPSLFLRFSPEPVEAMLGREAITRYQFDEKSMKARIRIQPEENGGGDAVRSGYLQLKRARATYAFVDHGVIMANSADCASFALGFRWPAKAPPGAYEVRVYQVQGGTVTSQTNVPLSVVRGRFPAWLAGLSENRASVYGITAVLAGALAGFGIDFLTTRIVGKKRAVSH